MFADDKSRLLSVPIRIEWAGWESDTFRLQQSGWEFSAEQLLERQSVRLMMRNAQTRMYGITNDLELNFFEYAERKGIHHHLCFHVSHVASDIVFQMHATGPMAFEPVDMQPQWVDFERKSIKDFDIFATPLVRTEEIILPEPSVAELLTKIREMQDPARIERIKAEIRARPSHGERIDTARPQHKFHAQIISMDGYRRA